MKVIFHLRSSLCSVGNLFCMTLKVPLMSTSNLLSLDLCVTYSCIGKSCRHHLWPTPTCLGLKGFIVVHSCIGSFSPICVL
uniref:Uncharacterized protein n=1 Tax=Arundo donax TaxID=35708 RepID=A0A0A9HAL7_ARUDO